MTRSLNKTILEICVNHQVIDNYINQHSDNVDIDKLINFINIILHAKNSIVDYKYYSDYEFSDTHVKAVNFLIHQKKLSIKEAILECFGLNDYQTESLIELYNCGMRGRHLKTFHEDENKSVCFYYHHRDVLSYLVTSEYVTPTEALSEIHELNEDQVIALRKLYSNGLRGNHLRQWHPGIDPVSGEKAIFDKPHTDTLEYLMLEKNLNPMQAINEMNELTYYCCQALQNLYTLGLRGSHLRRMPDFNQSKMEALISLVKDQKVAIDVAVSQLNQLGKQDWVDTTLASLYKFGLRSEHLLKYQSTWATDNNFSSHHFAALTYLLRDEKLTPVQAINEINQLPDEATVALKTLYQYGLRGADVRHWANDSGGYNESRRKGLIVLIKDKKIPVAEALLTLKLLDRSYALIELAKEYRPELSQACALGVGN